MLKKLKISENNIILEFLKGIGTIILYLLLTVLGFKLFGNHYRDNNILIATLSQLGTYFIMLIGISIPYFKRLKEDAKNFKKEYINIAIKNWIIGLGIMMISNIIITSFLKDIAANEAANRELLLNYPFSNIISMIIIGPFIEEITFRASFKKAFNNCFTFAILTSILFGLAHIAEFNLLELLFLIPYGTLGFFFAKAYYETNNIYTSYISHVLHNALCVLIILLF